MAVKEGYRNKGIGTKFMKNIFDILGFKNKYLLLEVENPNYGDNIKLKKRRVEFYKRHGARELKGVRYILPPLMGGTSTEMILMIMSGYNGDKIYGELIKDIIMKIYKELSNRDKDDPYLNSFIHDIPSIIELDNYPLLCKNCVITK